MHATQTPKCFLRMGLRVLLGLRHLAKVHLVHHKTCFSVCPGQAGMACCTSQGSKSQALLPKQQSPSRSRLRGIFVQTLLRCPWYSWGRACHFLLSSHSLGGHLQHVSQFPSREGGQQQRPAGSAEQSSASLSAEQPSTKILGGPLHK